MKSQRVVRKKMVLGDDTWSYKIILPGKVGDSVRASVKRRPGYSLIRFIREAIEEKIAKETN